MQIMNFDAYLTVKSMKILYSFPLLSGNLISHPDLSHTKINAIPEQLRALGNLLIVVGHYIRQQRSE